jgi:hypothetical protein
VDYLADKIAILEDPRDTGKPLKGGLRLIANIVWAIIGKIFTRQAPIVFRLMIKPLPFIDFTGPPRLTYKTATI